MKRTMTSTLPPFLRRLSGTVALGAALVAFCAAATPAAARIWVGFGFPLYFGPPVYYPPPTYYAPPPAPAYNAPPPAAYNAPAQSDAAPMPAGQSCYAGAYVCPMDHPIPSGANCYCPGTGGDRVWGHAS